MYVSRKCKFTNRPILPKERDSVQIHLAELNEFGRATGQVKIVDVCGDVRRTGRVDSLLYESESKQL
ncbi:rps21 [Nucleospora cyclopteri]